MLRLRAVAASATPCRSTWIALRSIPSRSALCAGARFGGDGVSNVPDAGVTLRSSSLTSCGCGDCWLSAGDALSGTESRLCGSVTRILGSASCMVVLACVLVYRTVDATLELRPAISRLIMGVSGWRMPLLAAMSGRGHILRGGAADCELLASNTLQMSAIPRYIAAGCLGAGAWSTNKSDVGRPAPLSPHHHHSLVSQKHLGSTSHRPHHQHPPGFQLHSSHAPCCTSAPRLGPVSRRCP